MKNTHLSGEGDLYSLPEAPTREDVFSLLAAASSYGNLGLFIGAGFSKAVLNDSATIALAWGELLEKVAGRMGIKYKSIRKSGVSYPEIASSMCKAHSDKNGSTYVESLQKMKHEIASMTSWYPTKKQRDKYSLYLSDLAPSWIITTNYDLVIESLLTGKSIPLGPNDSLSATRDVVPVFHLHGVRTNPEDIIISQEDYVALFRPSQYRQIKLALTIKESTTLFVGYGLGDVNVLTAIDWSRNVFKAEKQYFPNDVVQVLRKPKPKSEPYRDRNGIVIVESADLHNFFEEAVSARATLAKTEEKEQRAVRRLAKRLDSPDDSMIEKFIDDEAFREKVLKVLSKFSVHLAGGFISFLDKCLDETWSRSAPHGAFQGYKQNLVIILDILTAFPLNRFPPAIFQAASYGLERVGYFVGTGSGKSWAANDVWEQRKGELSADVVKELRSVAEQYGYGQLKELMESIPL